LPEESWFDVNMMQKDMMLALEMGRRLDVPLPTTAVTNEFLTAAVEWGWRRTTSLSSSSAGHMAGVNNPDARHEQE
jgi:3-hydroxyisobutyrate dehydrogenase-like beta-hydroxyacid dehydrogenase